MNKEIGIVQLWYNEKGKAVKAMFEPTIQNYGKDCVDQLMNVTTGSDKQKIKQDSEHVLSHWFNQLSGIELADRDQYYIQSDILKTVTWPNGNIQYCRLKFYLKKIKANEQS